MKKLNLLSLLIILFFFFVTPNNLLANYKGEGKDKGKKPMLLKTSAVNPQQSILNINNATMWVTKEGFHDWVVASSYNGAFPTGSSVGAIFAEGIVWGGQVSDGGSQFIRVDGNTYQSGTASITRLYRVRPDYLWVDLTPDAATYNDIPTSSVTGAQIQEIKDQYEADWTEWPVAEGAPYQERNGIPGYQPAVDANHDGEFQPEEGDIPGIPGASQTIFIKYNDSRSTSLYGADPIGMEISETYWGYATSGPLANVIFKKVNLVYKGTSSSSSNARIDSMFIVQWADPDVGTSSDDFAGCDTVLNMGYAYNAKTTDATYAGLGLAPPAVGYDFLQGASKFTGNPNDSALFDLKWRKGYKYFNEKPMSSFIYFAAGGAWSDPGFNYNGSLEFYNLMRGKLPIPRYPSASSFPEGVADVTPEGTYLLAGDPVSGTGKLDGNVEGPGDRRIMVVNGPISMVKGDTAQIVLGLVYGLGRNNISSISVMKYYDAFAQYAYDQLFNVPLMPTPNVSYSELDGKVTASWNQSSSDQNNTEVTLHGPYEFQAYAVYQLPPGTNDVKNGVLITTFDNIDNISTLNEKILDENTGLVYTRPLIPLNNVQGIQRNFLFDKDYINNKALINGQMYTFAITAIGYKDDPGLPAFILESKPAIMNVVPQQQMGYTFNDQVNGSLSVAHSQGVADATVTATVVDPAATTGHNYQVFFSKRNEIRNASGDWVAAGANKLRKPSDLTGTSISVVGVYGPNSASGIQLTFSLDLVSPTDAWSDGVSITFPDDVTIISAPSFEAGGGTIRPEIVGHTINFGDVSQSNSENGIFHGGETWDVFIAPPTLPLDIDWTVYDDTYGNPTGTDPVNATGTFTLTTIGSLSRVANYWNLKDVNTGQLVIENNSIYNGVDLYPRRDDLPVTNLGVFSTPIADGLQINIDGSYSAPYTISEKNPPTVNGKEMTGGGPGARWASTNFNVTDFMYFGYADGTVNASLGAYVAGGGGTTDIGQLQQDLELRWTGVLGDTVINGKTLKITKSGGSFITIFGASGWSIANHPLNPNPGSTAPFTVRVPFEVWNVEANQQINCLFWARSGNATVDGGVVWNTADRQYLWVVNTPYSNTPIDPASQVVKDHGTWNLVVYKSTFNKGDVLRINYDNPLVPGLDEFTFSNKGYVYSVETVRSQLDKINVFPNPYYGFQYRETAPNNKYVTFSHLPEKAVIRIFDLSGVLVKTIDHVPTNGQFETWNLANDNNYPVASGIYVAYIDMPDLGTTKVLKLAVIQEQQMLKVY